MKTLMAFSVYCTMPTHILLSQWKILAIVKCPDLFGVWYGHAYMHTKHKRIYVCSNGCSEQ